jgi:hypothetical protein
MLVAVLILGAMLMAQTAAVVTVGNTSAALETAKENRLLLKRFEHAAGEAAQNAFGVSLSHNPGGFGGDLQAVLGAAPLGVAELDAPKFEAPSSAPRIFPDLHGDPAALESPSPSLRCIASPGKMRYFGDRVSESTPWTVRFSFSRPTLANSQHYEAEVECRLVGVPLSRFGLSRYDLPHEIGSGSGHAAWPTTFASDKIAPLGLVASRDPASLPDLNEGETRPAAYREAASLAEAYQYLFSANYIRAVSDYAGVTHFVQIGASSANPSLEGGSEVGMAYSLDIALFGRGTFGAESNTKDAAVIVGSAANAELHLTDSGVPSDAPMLLLVAGPADETLPPLRVAIASPLHRPIVLVCFHCELDAPGHLSINGGVLLDPSCSVSSTTTSLAVGHLSCWGGGAVSPESFRLAEMPAAAERVMPRVVYAVAKGRLL